MSSPRDDLEKSDERIAAHLERVQELAEGIVEEVEEALGSLQRGGWSQSGWRPSLYKPIGCNVSHYYPEYRISVCGAAAPLLPGHTLTDRPLLGPPVCSGCLSFWLDTPAPER